MTASIQKKALKTRMNRRLSLLEFDRSGFEFIIVAPDVYPLYVCQTVMISVREARSIRMRILI